MSFAFSKKVQTCTTSLIPVLLLASLGIVSRCFESWNSDSNSNLFAGGLLLLRESSKVCFQLLKTFRVTPKTLPPSCLSEVWQLVLTCGVLILFLVVYAKLFHLAV